MPPPPDDSRRDENPSSPPARPDVIEELRVSQARLEKQADTLHRTRRALADARNRYLRLFDLAPTGLMVLDAEGVVRRINGAGAALVGLSITGAVDKPLVAFVDRLHHDTLRRCIASTLRTGHGETLELEFLRSGEHRRTRGELLLLDERELLVLAAFTDVSDRHRANRALLESEERYRQLFDASRDALLLVRPDGVIAEVNRAAGSLLGRPGELLIGLRLSAIVDDVEWDLSADAAFGPPQTTVAHLGDGRTRSVEASLSPVSIEGQSMALLSLRDITDRLGEEHRRRQLEARLQEAQRLQAIGTLAGGVAHDMNNLLTVISSIASVLWDDLGETGQYAPDLTDILQACRRGRDLTRNLLGFARKSTLLPERTGVAALVDEVVGFVRRTAPPGMQIEVDVLPQLHVEVDKSNFSRALMNLCVNARDATGDSGKVSVIGRLVERPDDMPVEVTHTGPYVRLGIADDGVGMPSSVIERAFEPFFTTKGAGRGTGLGLAQVYGMVRGHGGWARIFSEPGHGTEVVLYLPAVEVIGPRRVAVTAPIPIKSQVLAGTVMLIDDDAAVRRSTARVLTKLGFAVIDFARGADAVAVFDKQMDDIDAVVIDLIMPGMDGYEVYDAIRDADPDVPILLYSGYGDGERRAGNRIFDTHTGFVAKPFSPAVLEQRLKAVMHLGTTGALDTLT